MQHRVRWFLSAAFLLVATLVGGLFQLRARALRVDPAILSTLTPTPMHHDLEAPSPLIAERLNPRRFTAAQIRQEGDNVHLHGSVVMKFPSAVIHAEDAELDAHSSQIVIHGDARVEVLKVSARPDGALDQFARLPATDLRRFGAGAIGHTGTITHLSGDVGMQLPAMIIHAEKADIDPAKALIAIRGDSRLIFLKAAIEPDDQLGPWTNAQ